MKNFHSVNGATLKNPGIKIADKYNSYRLFVSPENNKKFIAEMCITRLDNKALIFYHPQ
jgi:hypothetical protein